MCLKLAYNPIIDRRQRGVVLLLTIVILVILTTVAYTVTVRVNRQRHRADYMVNYTKAQYACDSALKGVSNSFQQLAVSLISRPNEPDFSDLFAYSEEEYEAYLESWKELFSEQMDAFPAKDETDPNVMDSNDSMMWGQGDPGDLTIRGPYGPDWPYVQAPLEFEIGAAKVRVVIEDENAKYPLAWKLMADKTVAREVDAGFRVFCEWMGMGYDQMAALETQIQELADVKPYTTEFKPITRVVQSAVPATLTATSASTLRSQAARNRVQKREVITPEQQAQQLEQDLTRLFNTPLIDKEPLLKPILLSDARQEYALKYIGLHASGLVNINTAPRHVLEAAFTFGGEARGLAEAVIVERQKQPITDIEEFKKTYLRYAEAMEKCEPYICTASTLFTVRVEATCGVARVAKTLILSKDGNAVKTIAVVSG
ncbi:MAG: general secretion pathway protein GspK [Phycisphaerae bacterium]|nr:general secretion pathway protein GspK [Phycisphaerae bacterium]